MIITTTPFRVSFSGGGTDLKDYYKLGYGSVLSTTINKYMYITVNKSFDDRIRISYSETEIVDHIDKLKHPIVKAALKLVGIKKGIEITSIADMPKKSGLGSSSSFTVGLLNALYAYQGKLKSAEELAKEACRIEIDILKEPIGKQDQYAAAYGGFNHIMFYSNGSVTVEPVISKKLKLLEHNLLLFYTNIQRSASSILTEQKSKIAETKGILDKMAHLSLDMKSFLLNNHLDNFGALLDKEWGLKKQLASNVSNPIIDGYYNKAKKAGALGGKIAGAGVGGFLLIYCELNKQHKVKEALKKLRCIPFSFEKQGSQIRFVEG